MRFLKTKRQNSSFMYNILILAWKAGEKYPKSFFFPHSLPPTTADYELQHSPDESGFSLLNIANVFN